MMKKIILSLTLLIPLLFFGQTLDQYYAFYQTTGNFYDLSGATEIYQNQNSDDGSVTYIPIGFDFDYNGDTYNSCTISVNGAISFTELGVNYDNNLNSSATDKKNVIAPLWDDLYKRIADNGVIQYKTEGTVPNRRFFVEWKNISWNDAGQTVSFMLVLHETTNNIEFRYGPNNANHNNRTASIGINKYSSFLSFMSVTPGNPATVSSSTANNYIGTSQYPGEDTFYMFKHLTYIPDTNFENYLETHNLTGGTISPFIGNGINSDHYVLSVKAQATQSITANGKSITSLSGISNFTHLQSLGLAFNNLSNLFLNDNKELVMINVTANSLTDIDLSNQSALTEFYAKDNQITSMDLSHNSLLEILKLSNNQISSINLNQNTQLISLKISGNNLSSIDLSQNTNLQNLYLDHNQILGFFTTSFLPNLRSLILHYNQIEGLYLDNNTHLTHLRIHDNNLTSLSIQNGNNGALAGQTSIPNEGYIANFKADNNPYLTCIYVDNATAAEAGTGDYQDWERDAASHYVETNAQCQPYSLTYVPDDNFEHYLETHDASGNTVAIGDPNSLGNGIDTDDYVSYSKISVITSLNVSNKSITDLTGIEDFAALQVLDCGRNTLTALDVSNNTNLQTLHASNNALASTNLGNNANLAQVYLSHNNLSNINVHLSNLTNFNITYNRLTAIDLTYSNLLEGIDISHNQLTDFNVLPFTHLTGLSVQNNQLTSLNLTNNTSLTGIICSNNQLSVLDLSHQDNIANIDCSNNQITDLIISEGYYGHSDLMYLYADHNQITELDVSGMETLEEIDVSHNALNMLNVANGNNTNFGYFDATSNTALTCVQVDNATFMQNNWANAIDSGASYSENCHFGETYVPDDNFEAYLETHDASGNTVAVGASNSLGNGIANDDYVTTSNINTLISLTISSQNIADLTGIEDFELLQNIICNNNGLTSLNFSQNIHLSSIHCHNNQLTSLNVSTNTNLVTLWCQLNNLSTLNIDNNTNLHTLYCGNNQLSALDVGHNTRLEELTCYSNQLSSIDVSSNPNLSVLWVSFNQLNSLDLDDNTNIDRLWCGHNANLAKLRLQNGANNLLSGTFTLGGSTYSRMIATSNPNLTCIYVDDATAANNSAGYYHDWQVDATATYVANDTECNALNNYDLTVHTIGNGSVSLSPTGGNYAPGTSVTLTATPDAGWEFSSWSGDLTGITNPATITMNSDKTLTATFTEIPKTYVPDDNFEAYLEANGMGNDIANDDYVTTANINTITNLDISQKNIADLTGIEDFADLTNLNCKNNNLTSLDLSQNTELLALECDYNQLSSLSLPVVQYFNTLNCSSNQLTSLDVSGYTYLQHLNCKYNQINSLDLIANSHLIYLNVEGNDMTQLSIGATTLQELYAKHNQLTNLAFNNLSALANLDIAYNQFTDIDLSSNPNLTYVACSNNQLTDLNIKNSNNTAITYFDATNNPNLTCIQVDDTTYSTSNWTYIDATASFNENCSAVHLTVNISGNGSVALSPIGGTYTYGDVVTLTATPDTGWEFTGWSSDLSDTANPATITMDSDKTVTATFTRIQYTLSVNTSGNGNVTLSPTGGTYNEGTSVTLTATPDTGWEFSGWSGDLTGTTNPATITMDSDKTVTASFTELPKTYVPDDNFEAYLEAHGMGNGIANDDYVLTANIENVTNLNVYNQNIADLTGIEDFVALQSLSANRNNLTSIDLSHNTNLSYMDVGANNITAIDLSNNTNLETLSISSNHLSSLDLSMLPVLVSLDCSYNQLSDLNVKNGNNTNFTRFIAVNNPNLTCIQVDDAAWSTTNWTHIDATAGFSEDCSIVYYSLTVNTSGNGSVSPSTGTYAEGTVVNLTATPNTGWQFAGWSGDLTGITNPTTITMDNDKTVTATFTELPKTYVPDDNFEAYLEAHSMGNGIANDDYVLTANIENVTNLNIYNQNISDLTGIEDFAALQTLAVNGNNLTSIDVSHNTNLISLDAGYNNITAIDLSNNTNLEILSISRNNLSSLDISMLSAFVSLDCSYNQLSDLNVKNGNNTNFIRFLANYNPNLTCIQVDDAAWSTTNWTSIDATASFSEDCSIVYYSLTVNTSGSGSVSPSTGTYAEGTVVNLTATPDTSWEFTDWSSDLTGTTNPTTITMDSDKTVTATFSQMPQTYVPDNNFEAYLEANGMGNGITNDDYVTTANINTITNLDVSGLNIADLTGIEDFVSLTDLNCSNNSLTAINLSNLTHLQHLDVNGNQLTALDISHNVILVDLAAYDNQIAALDVSVNSNLNFVVVFNNQIPSLDVSDLANLQGLICNDNQISDIDVSNNHSLEYLWVHNNQLTGLNVQNSTNGLMAGTFVEPGGAAVPKFRATGNPNLTCIFVDDARAATAGTGDYQDWDIDGTSHFVETQPECDASDITDLDLKNSIQVYPNPVNNNLHIQSDLFDKIDIHIYNLVGQELIHKTIDNQQTNIDLTKLPATNYLVKIVVDNRSIYYNIIKE